MTCSYQNVSRWCGNNTVYKLQEKKKLEKIEFGLPPQTLLSHPPKTSLNENLLEKWEEGLRRKGEVACLLQFMLIREEEAVVAAGCWREPQTIVSAIEKCLGHWGQFKAPLEISWVNKGNPLDLLMTQFLIYRMGKIDGIVRLGALKIAQMITGAIERGFFSNTATPREVLRPC